MATIPTPEPERPLREGTELTPHQIYRVALDTRNSEISLFWQRSNFFLVLNTALAVGFFNDKNKEYASVRRHRWSHSKRVMDSYEIVASEVEPQGRNQALHSTRESIRQPSEPPQKQATIQVVPLCVAGGNVPGFRAARDGPW